MKISLAPIQKLNNVEPELDLNLKNNKSKSEPKKRPNLASIQPIKENKEKVGSHLARTNTVVGTAT